MPPRFRRRRPMRWRRRLRRRRSRNIAASCSEYQEVARRLRAGSRRLLEFDFREAARPQRQAPRAPADRARRLCADAAAGLYRAEAAGKSGARAGTSAARAQGDSGGRRSAAGRRRSNSSSAPQRPATELEFKRAYARVASAAGLTREQAVRVYSFETGGTGNYDVQSGIEHGGTRAISTAIGYNQLLTTNSVELIAEQGHEFVRGADGKGRATVRRAAPGDGSARSRC